MARLKRGTLIASTLMLIAVFVSACNRPFSTPPAVTDTPFDQSLFATPIGQTPGAPGMSDIELFGTGTAMALSGTPGIVTTQIPSTPVGIGTQLGTQVVVGTVTPTPLIAINATATSTLAVSGGGPLPTSMPVGSRPASYTLQRGEFPYCIARRFDVDPADLLSLNGLSSGDTYYPNLTLKIPQSGHFPGTRALRNHPVTYTVAASDETIYGIACMFGDVDPGAIAQANNLSSAAALTAGQQLSIP